MRIEKIEEHLLTPFPTQSHHICFDANCKRVFQDDMFLKRLPEHLLAPVHAS